MGGCWGIMATAAPITHTRAHTHTRSHTPTCRRQAIRARFSSSIHRIHPPSSTSRSSAASLPPPPPPPPPPRALSSVMCRRLLRSSRLLPSYPFIPAASHQIGSVQQAPGAPSDVFPSFRNRSGRHCCILLGSASTVCPPLLPLPPAPAPPLLLLLFLRYRDPARHGITSPLLLPLPLLAALPLGSLSPGLPLRLCCCRSGQRTVRCSVCVSARRRTGDRGALCTRAAAAAAPTHTHTSPPPTVTTTLLVLPVPLLSTSRV